MAKKVVKEATLAKSVQELRKDLAAKITSQMEAKRGHKAGELVNPRILTVTRKEIARLKTAIRLAEIDSNKENK